MRCKMLDIAYALMQNPLEDNLKQGDNTVVTLGVQLLLSLNSY